MNNRISDRIFDEKMEKVIFNEIITPDVLYHTYVCECNMVGGEDAHRYRIKRVITRIIDPDNREVDNTQIDVPRYTKNGKLIRSEQYEFFLSTIPTTSADITHVEGYPITWKALSV